MDKDDIIKNLKYLEDEREKLWKRIILHDSEISKKTSDYEKDAKQSSKMASEYKNRSEETKQRIDEIFALTTDLKDKINYQHKSTKSYSDKIAVLYNSSEDLSNKINSYHEKIESESAYYEEQTDALDKIFEKFNDFKAKADSLLKVESDGIELLNKIDVIYKNSVNRKRDIDALYQEINGFEDKDESSGLTTHVDGLKAILEKSYDELESNFEELNSLVEETKEKIVADYQLLYKQKEDEFSKTIDNWETKYTNLEKKITDLLPNALTAGLSHAYSEKKINEEKESVLLARKFNYGIAGLVIVSLIPFILSIIFILDKKPLLEVIEYSPRFVLAIFPLYIPVLWIAYSANKKLNLSKRLIEEYTHKEVLSKTFEGLVHQIDALDDEEVSAELRLKLLFNILSVSSENPGKLISDYNKSDHPLMDALEKSASLSDAVDKLEAIPGMSKLAKILERKSKRIIKEQTDKVDSTLGEIVEETLEE